jgi:TRAP-type transport system small permease protein
MKILEKLIDSVQMILLCSIVGAIGAQIFSRKIFNRPLEFPEELSMFILIAVVFLGIGMVENENTHIRVEFIYDKLPGAFKKGIQASSKILTFGLVLAILNGERQLFPRIYHLKTTAARIPYLWIHTVIVISCLFWLFVLGCTFARILRQEET